MLYAGTAIAGNLTLNYYHTYCKGYNQTSQVFPAEKTITHTIPVTNVAGNPQYGHFIEEILLSSSTPNATQLDSSLIEVDGIIKVSMTVSAIPTISGNPAGSANEPFILMVDIHYQSTQHLALVEG